MVYVSANQKAVGLSPSTCIATPRCSRPTPRYSAGAAAAAKRRGAVQRRKPPSTAGAYHLLTIVQAFMPRRSCCSLESRNEMNVNTV
jgi:hypothetical protein